MTVTPPEFGSTLTARPNALGVSGAPRASSTALPVDRKSALTLTATLGQQVRLSWPTDVVALADAAGDALELLVQRLLVWRSTSRPRCVLVRSTYSGEGRTSVVLALAYALSKLGEHTLLVDADFVNPVLFRRLSQTIDFGMDDVGAGQCTTRELVLWADELPIAVAPVRAAVPSADHGRVAAVVRRMVSEPPAKFALVIVDSHAIALGETSRIETFGADSALVVARQGVASPAQVTQLRSDCQSAGLEVVGIAETFVCDGAGSPPRSQAPSGNARLPYPKNKT